jgi:hypothetical protein
MKVAAKLLVYETDARQRFEISDRQAPVAARLRQAFSAGDTRKVVRRDKDHPHARLCKKP